MSVSSRCVVFVFVLLLSSDVTSEDNFFLRAVGSTYFIIPCLGGMKTIFFLLISRNLMAGKP